MNKIKILLIITIILAILLPILQLGLINSFLLILLCYLILIMLFNPKLGLFLLIIIRPCADILQNQTAQIYNIAVNFSYLLGIIAVFFSIAIIIKYHQKLKTIPLLSQISLFLFIALISCFTSINTTISFVEYIRLSSIFLLYFAGYLLINTKQDLARFIKIIILSSIIPCAFAFYQLYTNTGLNVPFEGVYNRILGTFSHPNLFAYYLIIPITLSVLLLLISDKKKTLNIFLIALLPIFTILLLLTYTRGAWLALLIIILLIGIIKYRKLLLITFVCCLFIYFTIEPINLRVNNTFSDKYDSISWRIELWKDSLKYARQKIILGYGTGTAEELILQKRGHQFGSTASHNDYIKIFLENGLLGLILYLSIIISLLFQLFKNYISLNQPSLKILTLIIIGITFALLTGSFIDNILRNTALQWIYWVLLGGFLFKNNRPVA
ncbi:O-antigen ligase family protein [Patescibacteria group bacterium]|nr:O-antigen ligase family protein [Patescibacteria group bacterium]